MPPALTIEVIEYRLRSLEEDRMKFTDALEAFIRMGGAVEEIRRDLVAGRERMDQQDDAIDQADDRITTANEAIHALALQLPVLKLTSSWVIAGVLGVFGIFGAVVTGVVLAYLKI